MINEWLIGLGKLFTSFSFLGLGASFLSGILVSFSPCIFPLIPITLGIVGAVSATTKLRGFLVSFVFVLGVAFIYTILGVLSALFGILWGAIFINPITYMALAIIFFTLSASSFGLIKINMPLSLGCTYKAKGNLISLFILGIISAFALIPCNFPVLGGILSLISIERNVLYGGTALFLFALGQGTLLIILGTSTSLIKKLPKQSLWLVIIRKFLGLVLALMGIYFMIKFIYIIL